MKIYLIKKFETNTCGMYAWEPWKIVNNYDLTLREIKNDVIDPREQLDIQYSTNDIQRTIKRLAKMGSRIINSKIWSW